MKEIVWRDTEISSHEEKDMFSIVKNGKGDGWVLIDHELNKTDHANRDEAKGKANEIANQLK